MPTAIALSFPAGCYHADPWGHHVNEGLSEWPPSPWRFLRALVATWKRKLAALPPVNEHFPAILRELISPPDFFLPPATLGHTRHFMPLRSPDPTARTKVFDAFVALAPEAEVLFSWPNTHLDAVQRQILSLVLSQLGFFGRAESWCVGRLLSESQKIEPNCRPLMGGRSEPGAETVRVLAAHPEAWHHWDYTDEVIAPDPRWNLLAETADLHAERWSDPPGSRWQTYLRPANAFGEQPASRCQPSASGQPRRTVARYALDAAVLPLLSETLPVAEACRRAVLGQFQRLQHRRKYGSAGKPYQEQFHSAILSGKDEQEQPLPTHGHAYYLPADEDQDGRIDHVSIVAADGFGPNELAALDALRRVRVGADEVLQLLLVGLGVPDDFRTALFGCSVCWESATPFLASRHFKARGRKKDPAAFRGRGVEFARLVLGEELERLRQWRPDLPPPESIEVLPESRIGPLGLLPLQFKRYRQKKGDDGGTRPAGAFRILFPRPITGPLCLGHSSHFGLGLFIPVPVPGPQ